MKPKPEGEQFATDQYHPQHPASWCLFRYFWCVVKHRKIVGVPYGQAWEFGPQMWTCYLRLRGPKQLGRRGFRLEHIHRQFLDPMACAEIAKKSGNPYLNSEYIEVTQEVIRDNPIIAGIVARQKLA